MGFLSKLFKKKNLTPEAENNDDIINSNKYLKERQLHGYDNEDLISAAKCLIKKQSLGYDLDVKDYFAQDIVNGVAEKKLTDVLKKTLNVKSITYDTVYPDITWEEDFKYATVVVTVNDIFEDINLTVLVSVYASDDCDDNDESLEAVIWLDKKGDHSDDDRDADFRTSLDGYPANVKNADFIYENAAEKVKEVLNSI